MGGERLDGANGADVPDVLVATGVKRHVLGPYREALPVLALVAAPRQGLGFRAAAGARPVSRGTAAHPEADSGATAREPHQRLSLTAQGPTVQRM